MQASWYPLPCPSRSSAACWPGPFKNEWSKYVAAGRPPSIRLGTLASLHGLCRSAARVQGWFNMELSHEQTMYIEVLGRVSHWNQISNISCPCWDCSSRQDWTRHAQHVKAHLFYLVLFWKFKAAYPNISHWADTGYLSVARWLELCNDFRLPQVIARWPPSIPPQSVYPIVLETFKATSVGSSNDHWTHSRSVFSMQGHGVASVY